MSVPLIGETIDGSRVRELPPGSEMRAASAAGIARRVLVGRQTLTLSKANGPGWLSKPVPQAGRLLSIRYVVEKLGPPGWYHPAQLAVARDLLGSQRKRDAGADAFHYADGTAPGCLVIGNPAAAKPFFIWVGEGGDWGASFTPKQEALIHSGQLRSSELPPP